MKRRGRWWGWLLVVGLLLGWLLLTPRATRVATPSPQVVNESRVPVPVSPGEPMRATDAGFTSAGGVFEVLVTFEGAPMPEVALAASKQRPTSLAWRVTWEPPLVARTDARGMARLPASDGNWVFLAAKGGFATAVVDVVRPSAERVTEVRVQLERGESFDGLALDEKDVAVAPATIRAIPLGDRTTRRRSSPLGTVETTVDVRGTFHVAALAAGWWLLEGDAEGAGRAEPVLINLPVSEVVRLHFRRSGFLEGVVRQPDGGVAPGAVVTLGSAEGAESLEASITGTFSVERVPGAYRVSAKSGELVGTADAIAFVRAGGTASTLVTLSGRGGSLRGVVKRDDGVGVEGALVVASPHNEAGVTAQVRSSPDGTWLLSGLARGSYDLEAEATGLMRTSEWGCYVAEGSTSNVDLVLGRLGRVTGVVENSGGSPLSSRVMLRSPRGLFPERHVLSDGAGHFAFDDVPPGPAFAKALRDPRELTREVEIKVQAGLTHELKLVVLDPLPQQVDLDRTRCVPASAVTILGMEANAFDTRHQWQAPVSVSRLTLPMAPGDWELLVSGRGARGCALLNGPQSVTLEAGVKPPPVRLVFGPGEPEFEISVLEADGQPAPFASITVRDDRGSLWASEADADGRGQSQFAADALLTVTATKQGRSAQVKGVRRALGHLALTLQPATRIHLRLEGTSGVSRVTALLEDDSFADELRASGAEVWLEEVPVGSVTLTATSADGLRSGQARVVTSVGQASEATIRLQALARVEGMVRLPQGTSPGASVSLGTVDAPVAADGSFRFDQLLAGDYTARVVCLRCGTWVPQAVSLAPGAVVKLNFP